MNGFSFLWNIIYIIFYKTGSIFFSWDKYLFLTKREVKDAETYHGMLSLYTPEDNSKTEIISYTDFPNLLIIKPKCYLNLHVYVHWVLCLFIPGQIFMSHFLTYQHLKFYYLSLSQISWYPKKYWLKGKKKRLLNFW